MAEIEQNKNNLCAYDVYIQDTYTNLFGKGIEYTSVFEFHYEGTAEVVNEPIEENAFASFYKAMQPDKITLVFGFNTDDYIQNQALTVIYERMKRYELITIATPQKIYLRVPDMSGEVFKKAKNMVDIFNEGTVKVIFYDSSTAKYSEYSERMFYSEYAIKELKGIIGEDNVVLK